MNTKPWYKSKLIWSGIITIGITVYNAFDASLSQTFNHHLPLIPDFVYGLLGAFGIYSRTVTNTAIK